MADSAEQANRIATEGKNLDYEQEAIDSMAQSWRLDNKKCMALALADAQVWATLHLARVTAADNPFAEHLDVFELGAIKEVLETKESAEDSTVGPLVARAVVHISVCPACAKAMESFGLVIPPGPVPV